jgi:hypothetical protein
MAEAEEIRHPDGRIEHPSVKHERSDASFRWIMVILVGAVVFAVVVEFAILGFFDRLRASQAEIKKSPFPLATGPSDALPPEPRLEQVDRMPGVQTPDDYKRESANREVLNSYGKTADEGFVHVPIDWAMKYLVEEKKLPARPEPPADQRRRSEGLVDAGEPNSGRLFKGGEK